MKKILFSLAAVAMLFATSCKKENINDPERPAEDNEFLCVIEPNANPQNAPRINDGMGTMAQLVDNRATWQEGDVIAYFGAAYDDDHQPIEEFRHELTCTTFGNEQTGSAYFEKENTHFGQGNHEAFYPAELLADAPDADHYTLALPAVQTIDPERNASNLPMYGVGSGRHYITFYNICGVLNIEVPVASDKIVLTAAQALCGPIHIGEDGKTAVADGTDEQDKTLTLVAKANTTFAEDGCVLAAIPAGTYNSLTIKFYKKGELVAEKTTENPLTIARNTIRNINTNIPREGLYFTANGDVTVSLKAKDTDTQLDLPVCTLRYAVYNSNYTVQTPWTDYNFGDDISLQSGQRVFFKNADKSTEFSRSQKVYYGFEVSGNGTVTVGGNIMYLIDNTGKTNSVAGNSFTRLFMSCDKLTSAKELSLPATTVGKYGYREMFKSCHALTEAPKTLPALTLIENCYDNMFCDCWQLTTAPELPAKTLASNCYNSMFENCTNLTTAPELPAKTLASNCYSNMFKGCTNLTTVQPLPAPTLVQGCYYWMFFNCLNLTAVTMLATGGYNSTSCLSEFLGLAGDLKPISSLILTVNDAINDDSHENEKDFLAGTNGKTSPIYKTWTIKTQSGTQLRQGTK